MSNVWKHPQTLLPGHTTIPCLALKSLFSPFSLRYSWSSLPCDFQPGSRVLSFGCWGPNEMFHLMAAFLGLILHSCVCEAEITSYGFFPFFFLRVKKGLCHSLFIFIIEVMQPPSKKIQWGKEVYGVTGQGPLYSSPSPGPSNASSEAVLLWNQITWLQIPALASCVALSKLLGEPQCSHL